MFWGMSLEGYSQQSSCEPFTATRAQGALTPFPHPVGMGGGMDRVGGQPRPMGGGVYLFAYLLIIPTCLGKEDHRRGYNVGPRSQSSQPQVPSLLP